MLIPDSDAEILRPLAEWQYAVGSSPEMAARRELWRRTNDREAGERPPILIYPEGSWREIDPVLESRCTSDTGRFLERKIRRLQYAYANFGDDMVINPYLEVSHQFGISDYGVTVNKRQLEATGSWKAEPPITDLERDLPKLHYREVTYDRDASEALFEEYQRCFGAILPTYQFSEYFWSLGLTAEVLDFMGMENFYMTMYDDPDGLKALMQFLMEDKIRLLNRLEELQIVTYNSECWHIGSGGLGFTHELPGFTRPAPQAVTFRDTWGLIESQETVGISPEMFAEFIWPYQRELAKHFGRLYYGCCEPIESRLQFIRQAPNLRGVSVSPWANVAQCAELCGTDFTLFCKPNPAHVALEFMEDAVRAELENIVKNTRGTFAAIILKDLHTVSGDLSKYGRWSNLARKTIERFR